MFPILHNQPVAQNKDTSLHNETNLFVRVFSGFFILERRNEMAKLNVKPAGIFTHEGARAKHINMEQYLRRSVMSCLLWEKEFYEDGQAIADRIANFVPMVAPKVVADIAVEARTKMKLRHAPLFLVREMARQPEHKGLVAKTLAQIIQRPDELTEFLAIYWKEKKQPLSAQVKKGLAAAFAKFDEYQLAKYNRDGAVKLRDVLFLCHAKPKDAEQDALWKRLISNELAVPDTWEVSLSAKDGIAKKDKWERLLREGRLGAMALLRNLRNFQQENVNEILVTDALGNVRAERVLPFRFVSASRYAPQWESHIERAMMKCLEGHEKLNGKTVLLVDVSGSMDVALSARAEMKRIDAACGLAVLIREICQPVRIFTFSNALIQIPDRRGFALRDAIVSSQPMMGTYLGKAVRVVFEQIHDADRLIIITDEQSRDPVPDPMGKGYVINVASYKNGVGYGKWLHIDGWSEAVIDYIAAFEKSCVTPSS